MYPTISEYLEAIKSAEDNFDQLKHLRPVLGEDGEPVMTSGNFAVVFKMKDEETGKLHAVKCFLREQEGRAKAYRQIAEELEYVSSTFLTPIKYLDKELFVDTSNSDESEFPVLLMDWVDGQTLDKYIREHIDDQYELSLLAYQFSRLAMWLMPQPFAHGDLKPDNILVKNDGTLVLVDYDGMYVPAMKGHKARELGSPDFRHPSRTEDVFDEHIDDFSLVSILLSLKAIALQPDLLEQYGASDRLLFSENDYRNLSESQVMDALKTMMQDTELATLYSLFILTSAQNNLSQASFRLLNLSRPQLSNADDQNTIVVDDFLLTKDKHRLISCLAHDKFIVTIPSEIRSIDEYAFFDKYSWRYDEPPYFIRFQNDIKNHFRSDYAKLIVPNDIIMQSFMNKGFEEENIIVGNVFIDDYGVIYSEDKTKLLCFPKELEITEYHILEGCEEIICDGFNYLPDPDDDGNVSIIGNKLKILHIPSTLKKVGENALEGCIYLKTFVVSQGLESYFLKILPNKIGMSFIEETDYYSTEVTEEDLKNAWTDESGVMYSADKKRLIRAPLDIEEYIVKDGTKIICDKAFAEITYNEEYWSPTFWGYGSYNERKRIKTNKICTIIIPDSVIKIGFGAFQNCIELKSIVIPNSVRVIGDNTFCGCENLSKISISKNIETIGDGTFNGCNLSSIIIPNSVKSIGCKAFANCDNLTHIDIPDGLTIIGDSAFSFSSIQTTMIPDSVTYIGRNAFRFCSVKSIKLSPKLKSINAFCFDSTQLHEIVIPDGIKEIESHAFSCCLDLSKVYLPKSVHTIGESAFYNCPSLRIIFIPKGTKPQFEALLREYKEKLVELDDSENLSTEVTSKDLANAWTDEYGVKYSADRRRLLKAPEDILDYIIRKETTTICDRAFNGCDIHTIKIPDSVKTIGESCFSDCHNLSSVVLPKSLRTIKENAFYYCSGLFSIFIPSNVNTVGTGAFACTLNLSSIIVDECNSFYDSRNNCNAILETTTNTLIAGCSSTLIPKNIKKIGPAAFLGCENLSQIIIPSSVEVIYNNAFYCSGLTSIEIPCCLNEIKDFAFFSCGDLSSITFLGKELIIGDEVFDGCPINEVLIPIGAKTIFERLLPEYKDKLVEQELGWTVKETRPFNAEEINMVKRAEVVASQYGNSVCFFMQTGGQTYIPLSKQSKLTVGDELDIRTAKLITLCCKGKKDIVRVLE